jgi:hypothetical protein
MGVKAGGARMLRIPPIPTFPHEGEGIESPEKRGKIED